MLFAASRNALHLDSGILIAVPIPQEYEADGTAIEEAIKIAYKEAELVYLLSFRFDLLGPGS